jgi:hypothetical protein
MALADTIRIELAGEAVVLHPALRHAIRLERRPGGFKRLIAEVQDSSLTAACEVIAPHYHHPLLMNRVFDAGLDKLAEPLTRYVIACAGLDGEANAEPGKGKTVTFGDYLASLYRIGTGWLGWTPDTTLDSTPHEIMEAHKGRVELLKSIFGGSEDDKPKAALGDKFRAFFSTHNAQRPPKES